MARRTRTQRDRNFWESAYMNNRTYQEYYWHLLGLAISMFEWKGLPDTIDERFLELTLFSEGKALFFRDEVIGDLTLQVALSGPFDVYRIPMNRRAYSANGYQKQCDNTNSVIIWNNTMHTDSKLDVEMFAKKLYDIDMSIIVNAKAQKTPTLILCDEEEKLTLENIYMSYEGNKPVIFGKKGLNPNSVSAISTGAPYVADKLFELKTRYWNEALTYLGISNLAINKKERLISEEVSKAMGSTIANRYVRLNTRKQAAREINKMFGLNIDVDYREDFAGLVKESDAEDEGSDEE